MQPVTLTAMADQLASLADDHESYNNSSLGSIGKGGSHADHESYSNSSLGSIGKGVSQDA
jgi:hypothetical protein